MKIEQSTTLLGGISPQTFMRRYWQKKPLLVRGAMPGVTPPTTRAALFDLAASDDVESRLVSQFGGRWALRQGPITRRALPGLSKPNWTLLVQGLDLHVQAAHEMLRQFSFIPDARVDDLMISYASDGGGVGPHFDSYDVFLIQVQGQRRWRIGRQADKTLREGAPVKLLANFVAEQDWVLSPGDMLYLPPGWAHDGVAIGECMTCSVGFKVPWQRELARELLPRLVDDDESVKGDRIYRDPKQEASSNAAQVPVALQAFAREAMQRALAEPLALERALGESLSEPKPRVWFEAGQADLPQPAAVELDRRTRMLYDSASIFLNGESFRASGRDAKLMRLLADQRQLGRAQVAALSAGAFELLRQWVEDGWVHPCL